VPDRRPLLENVTPGGKVDGVQPLNAVFENVGAGLPDAVTWKLPALPTKKLVELALVIAGALLVIAEASRTVRVKLWVAVLVASAALMHTV
jgi:hypothetical protein